MLKFYFFIIFIFNAFNAFSQTKVFLDDLKYEIPLTDSQKLAYKPFLDFYQAFMYEMIDSLSQKYHHIFKKYEKDDTGFIFLPAVYMPDSSIIRNHTEKQKGHPLFFFKLFHSYTSNIPQIGGVSMPIFQKNINMEYPKEIETFGLRRIITTAFHLYLPQFYSSINKKDIKTFNHKKLLNIFIEKKKKQNDVENNVYTQINNFFIAQNEYINFHLEEPNLPKNIEITKIKYELKQENENYILNILLKSKNLILFFPRSGNPIFPTFKFNKKRFDSGDFSEFAYLVNSSISSFVTLNK